MSLMSIDTPFASTSALTPTRARGLKRKNDEGSSIAHSSMMISPQPYDQPMTPQVPHFPFSAPPQQSEPAPMCDDNDDNNESPLLSPHSKQQKVAHCALQSDDSKCTRVKFAPGIILRTKKLYQEPWGVLVSAMEDYPPLSIKIGQRYWAKWDGMSCPFSCKPILQAIHSVAGSSQVVER